jgi:hypothetical protein
LPNARIVAAPRVGALAREAVTMGQYREDARRGRRSSSGGGLWQFPVLVLLVLTILAVFLTLLKRFPLETIIITSVFAIAGIGIVLYIWELVLIGWVVDFLSAVGVPKIKARPVPLVCEQVGKIIVVKLHDNIATIQQCQSVQKQLKRLIDEHHCDFVFDFSYAGRISRSFRGVMLHVMKAARREAENLGKFHQPVALSSGEVFRVFDDRERAIEEMSKHYGHGWVVLCSVPVGIRAVYGGGGWFDS